MVIWMLRALSLYPNESERIEYDALKSATTATGMFKTWQETVSNIISGGCSDIAQEVFTQKLGQAYRVAAGQGEGDDAIDYIESPYSKRSFQDYQDNIYSIKHFFNSLISFFK